ncbi:DEAD/DEAH box helicase [Amycolatopsis sp. NPDC059090]|uniref:DEAD/DEAH box helicase n=1 Tax=unclassified Amycolatopsis TaxID=2618356 RepID=UPI00367095E1
MSGRNGFHGLFVGVDGFATSEIRPLRFAKADARTLEALFRDNLGSDTRELCDAAATRAAVVSELEQLAARSQPSDVVVISYSGHGSPTHELATYDTDPADLAGTGLSLDELVKLTEQIPARVMLVVLDCCFSGAAAAKVIPSSHTPRGGPGMPRSVEAVLAEVSGAGRVYITAAGADQEAREDSRHGHGVLTHFVLQALMGAEEVVENGRVSLLRMFSFVQDRVVAAASSSRRPPQTPTLRGKIDARTSLPVLRPRAHYRALDGRHRPPDATADLASLRAHGIDDDAVLAGLTREIGSLNELQLAAVNKFGLLVREDLVICAPTAAGKTMVGILAADAAVHRGRRAVFLLPTRSLVDELYARLTRVHEAAGIRTLRLTGETNDHVPAFLRGDYGLAVLTYEKYLGLVLRRPSIVEQAGVLVVDEIQSISDAGRGWALELLLTAVLSSKARRDIQIVGLSAVLGGLGHVDTWLGAESLVDTARPVPLEEGVLDRSGSLRSLGETGAETTAQFISATEENQLLAVVRSLVESGEQVLVFRNTRAAAEGSALEFAEALGLPEATRALTGLEPDDMGTTVARLRRCLSGGTAFHTSDMTAAEGALVAEHFLAGTEVRVLVATTTLAHGVNLPADTVVLSELEHYGPGGELRPYSVADYKNMAGRAGRTGFADRGRSIILAGGGLDARSKWDRYVRAVPEVLRSSLLSELSDPRSMVLTACAVAGAGPKSVHAGQVASLLASTFAAHQSRMDGWPDPYPPEEVEAILSGLVECGLLRREAAGYGPTQLGEIAVRGALSMDSVLRVAEAFAEIGPGHLNRMTIIAVAQLTTELEQISVPVSFRHRLPEREEFDRIMRAQRLADPVFRKLRSGPSQDKATARVKRAFAVVAWSRGMSLADIEERLARYLSAEYRARAIIPVRRAAKRTADVVDAVFDVARFVHPSAEFGSLAASLPQEIALGVRAGLAPIALAAKGTLGRETFCALIRASITSREELLASDDAMLLGCLGGDRRRLAVLRRTAASVEDEEVTGSLALDEPSD